MYELQTTEKKAAAKMRAAKTVAEAAEAFDLHFERSDGSTIPKRIGYAEDAYRRFVA